MHHPNKPPAQKTSPRRPEPDRGTVICTHTATIAQRVAMSSVARTFGAVGCVLLRVRIHSLIAHALTAPWLAPLLAVLGGAR